MAIEQNVEVELKYRLLDLAAGERFLAAEALGPFRAVSAARAAQHEDRYLDTSDGALARAGYAARLRQARGGTVVTVKSTTAQDGALARREELEGPADRTAEPHDWPASAARSLILELCGDAPLVELVTVRQLRRKRRLKAVDATAELSIDEVDVVARGRVIHRFAELEAELTSGDEARLIELRPIFEADNSLIPATGSKLEAALAATSADDGKASPNGVAKAVLEGEAPAHDDGPPQPAAAAPEGAPPAGEARPTTPARPRSRAPPDRRPNLRPAPEARAGKPPRRQPPPRPRPSPPATARGSSSGRRRASWQATTSPRPAARCSASTWPG